MITNLEDVMSRRLSDQEIDQLHEEASALGSTKVLALIDEVRRRRAPRYQVGRGMPGHGSGIRHVHR